MTPVITLDLNATLKLEQLVALASVDSQLVISPRVYDRLARARAAVDAEISRHPRAIYGLTTGVGAMKTHPIAPDDLAAFNARMIRDHSAAIGEPIDPETTRLMMAIRIIELAQGGSGISLPTFRGLLALFNHGIIPVVPRQGSLGEADITVLAHVARVVMGEGYVWHNGHKTRAAEVLPARGLSPAALQPRDGLALIAGNSYMFALGSLAVRQFQQTHRWALAALALSWVAWQANPAALRADVLSKADAGTNEIGQEINDWLSGCLIAPRSIQDPLSWRCAPHVHSALLTAARRTERRILHDIVSSRDNPLLLTDSAEFVSNGNFDITSAVIEIDALRNSLVHALALLARRVAKLLSHYHSGLPSGLAPRKGDAGLALLEYIVSWLFAESQSLSNPTPILNGDVAEGLEDYGAMGPTGAAKLRDILDNWTKAVVIEMIVAHRAIQIQNVPVEGRLQPIVENLSRLLNDSTLVPSDMVEKVRHWVESEWSEGLIHS